jgi:hypothetical protein
MVLPSPPKLFNTYTNLLANIAGTAPAHVTSVLFKEEKPVDTPGDDRSIMNMAWKSYNGPASDMAEGN